MNHTSPVDRGKAIAHDRRPFRELLRNRYTRKLRHTKHEAPALCNSQKSNDFFTPFNVTKRFIFNVVTVKVDDSSLVAGDLVAHYLIESVAIEADSLPGKQALASHGSNLDSLPGET